MLEQIDALWAAVRQLQAAGTTAGWYPPKEPPAAVPVEDPEKAQRDFEAAQAEVKNQQDRAAQMIKWAEDNQAKAKAVLDASQAAAKVQEQSTPRPAEPPAERRR